MTILITLAISLYTLSSLTPTTTTTHSGTNSQTSTLLLLQDTLSMDSIHFAVLLSLVVCIANLIVRHYRNKLAEKEMKEKEKVRYFFNDYNKLTSSSGYTDKEFGELLICINERKLIRHGE